MASVFKIQEIVYLWYLWYTWYPWDLYPWGPLCHIQVQLQPVLVMVVSFMQSPVLHMDMDSDTGGLVGMYHGYTIFCLGFDLPTKCHHLVELWETFFGCVIFEELIYSWWRHVELFTWCWMGKGCFAPLQTGLLSGVLECCRWGSLGLTGLSSSGLLNTRWWYTGSSIWNFKVNLLGVVQQWWVVL